MELWDIVTPTFSKQLVRRSAWGCQLYVLLVACSIVPNYYATACPPLHSAVLCFINLSINGTTILRMEVRWIKLLFQRKSYCHCYIQPKYLTVLEVIVTCSCTLQSPGSLISVFKLPIHSARDTSVRAMASTNTTLQKQNLWLVTYINTLIYRCFETNTVELIQVSLNLREHSYTTIILATVRRCVRNVRSACYHAVQ